MCNQLNEKLVESMRQQLPEDTNLALVLMDILSIGKGAAYRRLSGEVMFSFDDAVKISRKLGFSLDKVIGNSKIGDDNQWAFVNMNTLDSFHSAKYMEEYKKKLDTLSEIFHNIHGRSNAVMSCAVCHLPYYFVVQYRHLSILRHYKKAYLTERSNTGFRFSDMKMPSEVCDTEKLLMRKCFDIPRNVMILNRSVFLMTALDIDYFYKRRLISDDELVSLKTELMDLLVSLENTANTGTFTGGTEILIYLSDVDLESSYAYLESDTFQSSLQFAYFVDTLNFSNPVICQIQKNWIESLKRYSTLITKTGEMQRVDFFNKQREIIESVLSYQL